MLKISGNEGMCGRVLFDTLLDHLEHRAGARLGYLDADGA